MRAIGARVAAELLPVALDWISPEKEEREEPHFAADHEFWNAPLKVGHAHL